MCNVLFKRPWLKRCSCSVTTRPPVFAQSLILVFCTTHGKNNIFWLVIIQCWSETREKALVTLQHGLKFPGFIQPNYRICKSSWSFLTIAGDQVADCSWKGIHGEEWKPPGRFGLRQQAYGLLLLRFDQPLVGHLAERDVMLDILTPFIQTGVMMHPMRTKP